MSNTLTCGLNLGSTKAGITDLRAQLRDSSGNVSGSAISTGFTEIGGGAYHWTNTFTENFRGSAAFYSNAAPTKILLVLAINSQEAQNADVRTSSIAINGTGAYLVIVHVTDGTNPLQNVAVRMTSGGGSFSNVTDISGNANFSLDAATYNLSLSKNGYTFVPVSPAITGNVTLNAAMTIVTVPTSPTPSYVNAYVYEPQGTIVNYRLLAPPAGFQGSWSDADYFVTANNTGVAIIPMLMGGIYNYWLTGYLAHTAQIPLNASDPYQLAPLE